jgi:hypothetical protein
MSTVRLLRNSRFAISRQANHLDLTARELGGASLDPGPGPEPLLDGLAEDLHLLDGAARERAGAELSRRPVGVGEKTDGGLTLAGGRQRHGGPDLGFRLLVWG